MSEKPRLLVEGGPVERRLNRLLAFTIGIAIGGLLSIGAVAFIALHASHKAGQIEHKTCLIQAHGLPASHHLSKVMQDINVLLQPMRGQPEPPEILGGKYYPTYFALKNLRKELPAYVALTAKQPMSRKC